MSHCSLSNANFFIALSTLLSDTESSLRAELQRKQSLIDQAHAKLRESTAALAEERRVNAELRRKSDERKALDRRIANLRRSNEEKRAELLANGRPGMTAADIRTDIKVGEADAGLEIDMSIIGNPHDPMTPQKRAYLATLPPTAVLNARTAAYKKHNARLEANIADLHGRSDELEDQLRQIVSICTGIEVSKIDESLDGLTAALASEAGNEIDMGRVREFLRKVESGAGE